MKYGLEIRQKTEEGESIVAVDAEGLIEEDAASLNYTFDDADYTLEVGGGYITQTRTGDVNLFMQFIKGRPTLCRIEDGACSGAFELYTKKLKIDFTPSGFNAECVYSDGQGGADTSLLIKAFKLEE